MTRWNSSLPGVSRLALFTVFVCLFITPDVFASCNLGDLQRCNSCKALDETVNLKKPDDGEYYRGAYWNGLFSAYVMNCQLVGKRLLDHHANPNLGGSFGSFLATVANEWPHKDKTINKQWATLLLNYKIDINWKPPFMNMSANKIIEDGLENVSYPDIWKGFVEKSTNGMK